MEPPSQVGNFAELSKQAQVTAGRSGKVANSCGPLTLDIVNSQLVVSNINIKSPYVQLNLSLTEHTCSIWA